MKYSLLLFILLIFSSFAHTQAKYKSENDLITRYRPGIMWFFSGLEQYEVEKLRKYDRLVVNINYNDWHGDKEFFESPWNSIGVDLALFFDIPFTRQNTAGMGIGIGYSHYSNRTSWQFSSNYGQKITTALPFAKGQEPKSHLYAANYIEIPLEFRFRSKGYSHFKFMVGGKIGYRINDYSRDVFHIEGKNYKVKRYGFVDSNPLRYGVTARIGIRNWALYGTYYFSPLFTNKKSVELYPFALGLSISLF